MGQLTQLSSVHETVTISLDVILFLDDPWSLLESNSPTLLDGESHDQSTAPLIQHDALNHPKYHQAPSQYGLLGKVVDSDVEAPQDPRNAPFSAVVCGVQGSGKSHTVSVLLEDLFIPQVPAIGLLQRPLSGLVLHYGAGGPGSRPCEAAFLASSSIPGLQLPRVKVYVSGSSLQTMRQVYLPLGSNVEVEPLRFTEEELDAQALLAMMSVGSSASAPLYIQTVLSILRDLGETFSLRSLDDELKARNFNPAQAAGLDQRLALLRSFMVKGSSRASDVASRFSAGQLTIIDLSDPFIDPDSASSLFEIIVRLFVRSEVDSGKVLVVDEAHKYLTRPTSGLTLSLLRLVREQRHLAMRVIISTQEPTAIPPVLLDLCTVTIMHRFSSPAWWEHLVKHVSANFTGSDAFDEVVTLRTGEALILAPSAMCIRRSSSGDAEAGMTLGRLGRKYLIVQTRLRLTADGGASVLVVN
ncbi:hypothetical protein ONZ45_g29 [Pleurotus djamor]|nr:hypothetical protein ONZ45_g29 [Pleurotus djamor]